jgi:hypothetical protein
VRQGNWNRYVGTDVCAPRQLSKADTRTMQGFRRRGSRAAPLEVRSILTMARETLLMHAHPDLGVPIG